MFIMETPFEKLAEMMTVSDLAKYAGKSVSAVVDAVLNGHPAPKPSPSAKKPPPRTSPVAAAPAAAEKTDRVNLYTKEGRDAYDRLVSAELKKAKGEPVSAAEIRKEVGGTPTHIRASLNRLIEDELVSYEGKARSTRYRWVG